MANGTLKVSNIETSSGSGTITLGASGETVDLSNGTITLNDSMKMTPAFLVSNSANNTGKTDNTAVKLTYDTEVYDTDSAFASSKFTVPAGKAGKYFFTAKNRVIGDSAQGTSLLVIFYKNGSSVSTSTYDITLNGNYIDQLGFSVSTTMDLSAGDYIEVYGKMNVASGTWGQYSNGTFSGFRLIGV